MTSDELLQLLEAVTGLSRAEILAGAPIDDAARERADALMARRAAGEPLQYVTGVAGFRRLELAVGPGVLVPRPETELVAGRALELLPEGGTLVDVGTGSGAIALAVADERPDAKVIATEVSPAALGWARRNRDALGLDFELIACDLLSGLPARLEGQIDVIVSNPPYVAETEREVLPTEVVDHEPEFALFAGRDGLAVITRVAAVGQRWLRPGAWLVLEIGETQGQRVSSLLDELGYVDVCIDSDLAGRDRIAEGRTPA
ncbi:MAG: peptide chain release factor N(5)-glutamine methyltransferase [Actinomycetota bacterium]